MIRDRWGLREIFENSETRGDAIAGATAFLIGAWGSLLAALSSNISLAAISAVAILLGLVLVDRIRCMTVGGHTCIHCRRKQSVDAVEYVGEPYTRDRP